jgi:hypothetical protein
METNKVMHKNMHTNVLRFHNTWEEHEVINLKTSIDFKLESIKFANEYFEIQNIRFQNHVSPIHPQPHKNWNFIQVPTTNIPCKKIIFCRNHLTKQGIMGRFLLSPMMLITLTQLEGEEVFGSTQQKVDLTLGSKGDLQRHDCVTSFVHKWI